MKRKLKAWFFRLQLHRLIPYKLLSSLYWLCQLSQWVHEHRHEGWTDYPCRKHDYQRRYDLYLYLMRNYCCDSNFPIDYLEFGVGAGHSFRWWQTHNTHPDSRFFGFDTFEGLPEGWGKFKRGDMKSEMPNLLDFRCYFYKGLFENKLLQYLEDELKRDPECIENPLIIHMDADLYSSTFYVLSVIVPILCKDDIIIFDEFNVPEHEFKAFWLWQSFVKYEVLCSYNNFHQIAIRIL